MGCGSSEPPFGTEPPSESAAVALGSFSPLNNHVWLHHADGGETRYTAGGWNIAFSASLAVAGDFDGDGRDTLALLDVSTGVVRLLSDHRDGGEETLLDAQLPRLPAATIFPQRVPFAGDFDGDGVDSIGFSDTRLGEHHVIGPDGNVTHSEVFGPLDSWTVAGDFDGDGIDTLCVFDPIRGELHVASDASVIAFGGPTTQVPLAGDFDGDGRDSVALYDFMTGILEIRHELAAGPAAEVVRLAPETALTWLPLAGHWGDAVEVPYGGHEWTTSTPAAEGFDEALLDAGFAEAAGLSGLHSLLVVRHGKLVREAYFKGFDAAMPNNVKSVSKSILSALYGIAWQQGLVDPADMAMDHLPPELMPAMAGKEDIAVAHLLTMTAGLAWSENDPSVFAPFAESDDPAEWVLTQTAETAPGTVFNYSTGLTHVASAMLTQAAGQSTSAFAQQHLYDPLGIRFLRWDRDSRGRDFGGAEVYLVPRDMARFGELYLRGGQLDGQQIVPSMWVDGTTVDAVEGEAYGAWWWIRDIAGYQAYLAWGYGGQFIFVIEDLDLVMVATSAWNVAGAQLQTQYDDVFRLANQFVVPAVIP